MNNAKIPKDIIPTLVIGLGGTGFQVVKRLKALVANRYGEKKLPIRYLIIDTDLKSFLDDSIANNERCQLRFGESVKSTLDWAYGNSFFQWLPYNPKITPDFFTSTDQGAGLMRPIGRLYLCKNAKLVYDALKTAKSDLADLFKMLIDSKENDMDEVFLENIGKQKVYLVGSLAGGTGCGTFLDVAVMLSKVFNKDVTNITGMFTLESCYDDKLAVDLDAQNRSKANCYAALKELEFYMSSIKEKYEDKYIFNYLHVGEIKLEKKLLDICYLIEKKNEEGGELNNIEDIYDLCSLQLFQEFATKLGSQLRADYANFICKDKDPILDRERHFSSFASSSMELPIESLRKYCVNRLAKDILKELIKNNYSNNEEEKSIINEIVYNANKIVNKDKFTIDFISEYGINSEIKYSELKDKIMNLSKLSDLKIKILNQFNDNLDDSKKNIENIINLYINEKGIKVGLMQLKNILEKVNLTFKNFNDSNNIDEGKILELFNKIKEKDGFLRKKETIIPKNDKIVTEYNNYLDRLNESVINSINKSIFYLVKDIIDKQINNLDSILGNLSYSVFEEKLNKIKFQANKRFGGNIIAREMIGNNFYDKYYLNKFINKNLPIKINSMFNKVSILEFFKKRQNDLNSLKEDILTEICEKEFEKLKCNISIIDVLKENANLEKIRFNEYIKKELDLTSKLTKPFWSAQKSPELSWTECYYIGSVRDETITNGITEKPNEAIDFWIRNQAGERSKQAKYVETTNPYSIDVIHIMMGACAAYLPEIQNYKQYYLNLLSSKTYPLHLDESYVGFDDLDISTQQLLDEYCLAKAYGAIIKIDDEYVLNIKKSLEYIYNSKFSLGVEDIESLEDKNIKKQEINMELILGKNEAEVLNKLVNNKNIVEIIKKFLNMCNKKYTTKYLLNHKKKYISELIMKENIIAYEKLKYKTSN